MESIDNLSLSCVERPLEDIEDVILANSVTTDTLMNINEIESLFPNYKDVCDLSGVHNDDIDMNYDFFNFDNLDMNNILNQDIISDCMWSSTQLDKNRRRDSSWCLSEPTDSHAVTTNVDLSGVQSPTLESQTLVGCGVLMETNSDTDTDEGEIDVVSSEDGNDYYPNKSVSQPTLRIEPGRSLLLSRNLPSQQQQQQQSTKQPFVYNQTFVDHCYFLPPPPSPTPDSNNKSFKGMLTPNETSGSSSDDEETTNTKLIRCKLRTGSTGSIDKRKIVQAVQSLIKNDRNSSNKTSENVKFRFRMKFKNGSSLLTTSATNSGKSSASVYRENTRRRSALLNPHCPSPQKMSKVETTVSKGPKELTTNKSYGNTQTRIVSKMHKKGKKSDTSQKCRESRDLHNSMERQRRIDLRKNFNQLKAAIPELAVSEKASKLNILKQATDFSQHLTTTGETLKEDLEKELARHAQLKKKFLTLQSYFDHRPLQRHTSVRVGNLQPRRVY